MHPKYWIIRSDVVAKPTVSDGAGGEDFAIVDFDQDILGYVMFTSSGAFEIHDPAGQKIGEGGPDHGLGPVNRLTARKVWARKTLYALPEP